MNYSLLVLASILAVPAEAKQEKAEVIACMGNSILRGDTKHEPKKDQEKGKFDRGNWPRRLENIMKGVDAGNFGSSGAQVEKGKNQYITSDKYSEAVAFKDGTSDTVIIQLGINDAKTKKFANGDFDKGYKEMLEKIDRDFPDLTGIYVMNGYNIILPSCCDINIEQVNKKVIPAIEKAAKDVKLKATVYLIDSAKKWADRTTCGDKIDWDKNSECAEYFDGDGIHTSRKGADLLAEIVKEALEGDVDVASSGSGPAPAPAPAPRQPTKQPTGSAPAPRPAPAPAGKCADNKAYRFQNKDNQSCKWIKKQKNKKKLCKKKINRQQCAKTCQWKKVCGKK